MKQYLLLTSTFLCMTITIHAESSSKEPSFGAIIDLSSNIPINRGPQMPLRKTTTEHTEEDKKVREHLNELLQQKEEPSEQNPVIWHNIPISLTRSNIPVTSQKLVETQAQKLTEEHKKTEPFAAVVGVFDKPGVMEPGVNYFREPRDTVYRIVIIERPEELLALQLNGIQKIDIKIVGLFKKMGKGSEEENEQEFLQWASINNKIYTSATKTTNRPKQWIIDSRMGPTPDHLVDDPNYYFASLIARTCNATGESNGAEYPVFVITPKDDPFMRVRVAELLNTIGIQYQYAMGTNETADTLKNFIEDARRNLYDAIQDMRIHPIKKNDPIAQLKLIDKRTRYTDVNNGKLCAYTGPAWKDEKETAAHTLTVTNATGSTLSVAWLSGPKNIEQKITIEPGGQYAIPNDGPLVSEIAWRAEDQQDWFRLPSTAPSYKTETIALKSNGQFDSTYAGMGMASIQKESERPRRIKKDV